MDDVLTVIQNIMTHGEATSCTDMGITAAGAANYPECGVRTSGYLIDIVKDGPADQAGLRAGDVITMVDAEAIMNSSDLTSVLGIKSCKAGDTSTAAYVRDGQVYTAGITFGSTAGKSVETAQPLPPQAPQDWAQDSSGGINLYPDMERFFNSEFFEGYDFGG